MSLILSLDQCGQPTEWISWQDAVVYQAKDMVAWSIGEIEFTFHGGNNRITGKQSVITTASIIAIKGKSVSQRRKPPGLNNRQLFRRDRHICAYCGKHFQDAGLTRDHIIPKAKNGVDTWMNCVSACRKCNNFKDDRTLKQCGLELLYVPYIPCREESLLLENRNVLYDQMMFLSDFLPKTSRMYQEVIEMTSAKEAQ
jgi:5-methylcytosine-specific restriction endonuclease McrA